MNPPAHAPPAAFRDPLPDAERFEREGKNSEAFQAYRNALQARIDGEVQPAYEGNLAKVIDGLARLGKTYPPARAEVGAQREKLATEIVRDASTYDPEKLLTFWFICRHTGQESAALAVLKSIPVNDPRTLETRGFLAASLLAWMHANGMHQEIVSNEDAIQQRFQVHLEMARVSFASAVDSATILYEALLATGKVPEARRVSDEVLAVQPAPEMIQRLLDAAKRAGATVEVERLGSLLPKQQAPHTPGPPP